jgi:hypothetical protein
MDFLFKPEIWWIAQIALDVILLAAVFVLASRIKPRAPGSAAQKQAGLAAADFVDEAGRLAREFDRLLGEKRELVGTALSTLDGRIEELKAMLEQLQNLKQQILKEGARIATPAPGEAVRELSRNPLPSKPALPPESPFTLPPGHPLHHLGEEKPLLSDGEFRAQVMRMAAQGHSPQDIALATGRPRAEVELMMALRKPRNLS